MSEDLFELESTYDRRDLAAVFEEVASALAAGRSVELETADQRLRIDVPRRVLAEFELEREVEDEADETDETDEKPPVATVEFEIELEWDEPLDGSSVRIEPSEAEGAAGSADAVRDESETETDRSSMLRPTATTPAGDDGADDAIGDDEPGESTSSGRRSRFEIYRDRADEWRWRLVHWNGNVVADSGEGYASRSNAERAARSVMDSAPTARIERLESDDQ